MGLTRGGASVARLGVTISAEFGLAGAGGILQATAALVHSLGRLDGPEQYDVVVSADDVYERLEPHLGPNQRIRRRPTASRATGFRALKQMAKQRLARAVVSQLTLGPQIHTSDGFVESLGNQVLHFPHQGFYVSSLPTIYNPHDLQHCHLPQFFSPEDIALRHLLYGTACALARTVVVASEWVRADIIEQFRMSPTKIQVIPWAAPTGTYVSPTPTALERVRDVHRLPKSFLLYPAHTWPHKNHLALFEAMAILRTEQGLEPHLVCTGGIDERSWPVLAEALDRLALRDTVHFLGFVDEEEIRCLYRLASALVMPTLFEAVSFPIFEAWLDGLPVACSNVTALPDQVADAALVFEPEPRPMADALLQILTQEELRRTLQARGLARERTFTWERTAKAYRAVYRRAAGCALDEEDRTVLEGSG